MCLLVVASVESVMFICCVSTLGGLLSTLGGLLLFSTLGDFSASRKIFASVFNPLICVGNNAILRLFSLLIVSARLVATSIISACFIQCGIVKYVVKNFAICAIRKPYVSGIQNLKHL